MPENFPIIHEIQYTREDIAHPFVLAFVYFYIGQPGVIKGPFHLINKYITDIMLQQRGPCVVHYTAFRKHIKSVFFNVFGLNPNNFYRITSTRVSGKKVRVLVSITQKTITRPVEPSHQDKYSRNIILRPPSFFRPPEPQALYHKFIREMPRGWFADFDPYVPAEWVERKKLMSESNKIVMRELRRDEQRVIRVFTDDHDLDISLDGTIDPEKDTQGVKETNTEVEKLVNNLHDNSPFSSDKIEEIIDFLK